VIAAMGFTEAGIAAATAATAMMSAEALAAGGVVVAGGTVATLQSVGVAGLGMVATTGIAGAGALVGAVALGGITYLLRSNTARQPRGSGTGSALTGVIDQGGAEMWGVEAR